MIVAIVIGLGFGAGVLMLVWALIPPRRDLAAAVGRWDAGRAHPLTVADVGTTTFERGKATLGRWAVRTLTGRGITLTGLRADLELVGRTLEEHLVAKIILAVFGLLLPTGFSIVLRLAGIGLPVVFPVVIGIFLGLALSLAPDVEVRRAAATKRDDLRRALGAFLDLVSMSLAGGRGVPEALPTAAGIGTGWAFDLLSTTISRARYRGVTPWSALGELGERIGMQELTDLGAALTLVSDDGAKVRDSLAARAATLRRRQLAEAEGKAEQASEALRIAQLPLALGFIVFLGYPALIAVLGV